MSEFERDDLVGAVLTDVSREVSGHIRPLGAQAAVRTVRRRRRQRTVAGGVLAAALIIAPLTGLALANNGPNPSPTVGTGTSTSPSMVDVPPQGSPGPSGPPASSDAPAIPASELRNGTLPIAAWPTYPSTPTRCETGQVKFTDGKAGSDEYLWMEGQPLQVDIDGDGGKESVVHLYCRMAQTGYSRVVVFDRTADGGIRNVGTVLTTVWAKDDGKEPAKIWEIQVTDNGQIRIDVGDYEVCCGGDPNLSQHQWRTYGWNGTGFVQIGGPWTFPPNLNRVELSPTAGELTMVRQPDGQWRGTLRVTVRNAGQLRANPILYVRLPAGIMTASLDCALLNGPAQCSLPAVEAGASTTVDLVLTTTANPAGQAEIRVYDNVARDSKEDNNTVTVTVKAS
ncbi:hypothetical protein Val02_14510 [Virgisporangium aliadipatigenens]|uniref:Uncharacterized protein n=1 Tax=Virgisporangium aliadipatigenens TaxID=741659 RepID=A0A8J3YIG9_9ACTN|nr:hypothetical protein [Virgisporangium aliadipatigenens]GIJ44565.1 hypothetical protein Val02_14510 [Virgisporangium aliadipatigenens]